MSAQTAISRPWGANPLPPYSQGTENPSREEGLAQFRPLEQEFDSHGWHFLQLIRVGGVCLFLKTKRGATRKIQSWEVILPILQPAKLFPSGSSLRARETYPYDEQWGKRGWTYMSEAEARVAFLRLVSNETGKPSCRGSSV